MKPVHAQLPKGARIYLPDEAARKLRREATLRRVPALGRLRKIPPGPNR